MLGPKKVDLTASEGDLVEFNGAQGALVAWNDMHFGFVPLSGIQTIANTIPDMGAVSSINLLKNSIPVEQAQKLVKIMQAKEKLTTLCGLSKEETELNFSDQYLGAGDVVLIANDISEMNALTKLDISENDLEQGHALQQITECCITKGIQLDTHTSPKTEPYML
jgi:hypothetical protein